jgi:hypothetical protein
LKVRRKIIRAAKPIRIFMKKSIQNRNTRTEQNIDKEIQTADAWMQKFAEQTALPQNLPAPGLLLFKARLIEKQSAVIRAVQPIIRAQIASVLIFALGAGWLLLKSRMQIGSLLKETFLSLSSVATLFVLGVSSAVLICLAFAYFLRETKEFKK